MSAMNHCADRLARVSRRCCWPSRFAACARRLEQGGVRREDRRRRAEGPGRRRSAAPSKDIVIEAPQIAENGAVVPIEISSNIPGTTSIAVVIEKNPFPLAAQVRLQRGRAALRQAQREDGRDLRSCAWSRRPAAGSTPRRARSRSPSAGAEADMAGPMKMRATVKGDIADVRVLMIHPMETGQRKDQRQGRCTSSRTCTVKQNGKMVVEAEISQAVSRNPVFSFRLKGGAKGDKIEVSWLDNKGETQQDRDARSPEHALVLSLCVRPGLLRRCVAPGRQEGNREVPADDRRRQPGRAVRARGRGAVEEAAGAEQRLAGEMRPRPGRRAC